MAFDILKPSQPATRGDETLRANGQQADSGRSRASRSWSWLVRLALLTVAVFAVHLALLNSASLSLNLLQATPSIASAAFITRTITPAAPAASAPSVAPPPPLSSKVSKASKPAPAISRPQLAKPLVTSVTSVTPVTPATPASTTLTSSENAVTPTPLPETPPETIKEAEVVPALPPTPSSTPALTGETAASLAGAPAAAFAAPPTAKYIYNVVFTKNTNSNKGTAELIWQHDGENYVLSLTASYFAIPVFIQKSVGQLASQGLRPTRFSDKRFRKSEVAAHFNHELGKITFSANTPDVALLAGAQDRVSVILQLAGLLAADPAKYPPGASLNLQTVGATEAEPWLFTVNEPETLNLAAGPQIALRITRNPRREFDQKVELWFAPALNHAPVRFRFTETSGDYVDAQLQSAQYLSPLKPN